MAIEPTNVYADMVDVEGDLKLFHGPSSAGYIRGDIYDNEGLLVKTFGLPNEYNARDAKEAEEAIERCSKLSGTWTFSHEGTLLRLFYMDGSGWKISTHRRLNATSTFWGCRSNDDPGSFDKYRSFGEMFEAAVRCIVPDGNHSLNDILNILLDKSIIYCVMLLPTESTRMVSDAVLTAGDPTVMHIAMFERRTGKIVPTNNCTWVDVVISPVSISFGDLSPREILQRVEDMPMSKYQGIIFTENGTNCQTKIYSSQYYNAVRLRGNEANILRRYTQIRLDKSLYRDFVSLYPLFSSDFLLREAIIIESAQRIYDHHYSTSRKSRSLLMAFERGILRSLYVTGKTKPTLYEILAEVSTQDPIRLHSFCSRMEDIHRRLEVRRKAPVVLRKRDERSFRDVVVGT